MKKPVISVIGLGFVGLTLAVVNAKKGFSTIGIDNNKTKLTNLQNGKIDFFEPKLSDYLKICSKKGSISFSSDYNEILNSDITFVTVGTPSKDNGNIDLTYVNAVIRNLTKILKKKKTNHLVVIKSTVVPTTTMKVIYPKLKKIPKVKILVNPEFLRESNAINDLLDPHLIVIGEENGGAKELEEYYKKFYRKLPEILNTNFTTAEMIKYTNNSFLATKISFINSIANICQNVPDADVKTISYAIGKDVRIGPLFLNAGPGFGGSCLPKDLTALISFSEKMDNTNNLLKEVLKVNQRQPEKLIKMMNEMNVLKTKNFISVLGLAFKKDTDDIRDSISINFVKKLLRKGIKIKVHDPMAIENFRKIFQDKIIYCKKVQECIEKSDCCVILTDWDEYRKLNPLMIKKLMNQSNIIDSRRILNPDKFKDMNFKAIGLGS